MAGRDPVAGRARGGEVIQALRPARARLIPALAAFVALAAVVLDVASTGGRLGGIGEALGGVGLLVATIGLVLRWPQTITWAVLLVGGGYLLGRVGSSVVDGRAAVIGVVLLASAELATWSIEHDARVTAERALVVRRVGTLGALLVVASLVNLMLLATAGIAASAGVLLAAAGVAAAVAALAVVLRLVRA